MYSGNNTSQIKLKHLVQRLYWFCESHNKNVLFMPKYCILL